MLDHSCQVHRFVDLYEIPERALLDGRKANSGMAFAWFIWDRAYSGPTTISWEEASA